MSAHFLSKSLCLELLITNLCKRLQHKPSSYGDVVSHWADFDLGNLFHWHKLENGDKIYNISGHKLMLLKFLKIGDVIVMSKCGLFTVYGFKWVIAGSNSYLCLFESVGNLAVSAIKMPLKWFGLGDLLLSWWRVSKAVMVLWERDLAF